MLSGSTEEQYRQVGKQAGVIYVFKSIGNTKSLLLLRGLLQHCLHGVLLSAASPLYFQPITVPHLHSTRTCRQRGAAAHGV